jgi:hypothetical protein
MVLEWLLLITTSFVKSFNRFKREGLARINQPFKWRKVNWNSMYDIF